MNLGNNLSIELKCNEKYGKYCVAKRPIRKGELILCENCLFIVPNYGSKLCCWNCNDKFASVCTKCKVVPFCALCRTHPVEECNYLIGRNLPENFLAANPLLMLPLKCVLSTLNEKTRDHMAAVMEMESHMEKRGTTTNEWKFIDTNIIQPLKRFQVFDNEIMQKLQINDASIQKLYAIFDVNALDVRGPNVLKNVTDGVRLRAIYSMTAYLSHSCCANILLAIDSSFMIKIYASRDIQPGEIICYSYTDILMNTQERKSHLYIGKYFKCDCKRCLDPTENGTHFSSIKCQLCNDGYYLPIYRSQDTDTSESKCNNCNAILSHIDVDRILSSARADITKARGDLFVLEKLVTKLETTLHPNHSIVVELKQEIASILRAVCVQEMPGRDILKRKYDLCNEILEVLRKLQPGISRLVGIALYETYSPFMRITEYDMADQRISMDEFLKQLHAGEKLLKEAISHLMYDDRSVPEGQLAHQATMELNELQNAIHGVQICLAS